MYRSRATLNATMARQVEQLRKQAVRDRAMILLLADRVYAAHEVLARRAEKKGTK